MSFRTGLMGDGGGIKAESRSTSDSWKLESNQLMTFVCGRQRTQMSRK